MLLKLIKKMTIPAIKAMVLVAENTGIIRAKAMRAISTIKSGITSWRVVCPPMFKSIGFGMFLKLFFSERPLLSGKNRERDHERKGFIV